MPTLRQLLLDSRDGEWGKGAPFDDSVEMSVIRGTDFASVRIGKPDRVPVRHLHSKHAQRKALRPWDILIETAGGTNDQPTGRTFLLTPSRYERFSRPVTCASFARFLRVDPAKADPAFVFWLLQHEYRAGRIRKFHTQHTGVARFQFTTFADSHELALPPRPVQERIAHALSNYDDLVEVNHRRTDILTEMSDRLFDEWFVSCRFPGSEHGPKLPAGWQPVRLGQLLKLHYGKALRSDDRRAGGVPVYGSSGQVGEHDEALVRGPGIIVGRKGNVGSVFWSSTDYYPIDTVFFVESSLPLRWVEQLLRRQSFLNSDAAVPGLNRNQAYSMEVVKPPDSLIDEYAKAVEPFGSLAKNLADANARLRAARDLLLPKLLSGDVELAVDRAMEAA